MQLTHTKTAVKVATCFFAYGNPKLVIYGQYNTKIS